MEDVHFTKEKVMIAFSFGVVYGIIATFVFIGSLMLSGIFLQEEHPELFSKECEDLDLVFLAADGLGAFRVLVWSALALLWPLILFFLTVAFSLEHVGSQEPSDQMKRFALWVLLGFGKYQPTS